MAVETIPWHVEGMKQHSWLQRIGTYLLGLVDEYWAMRRRQHLGYYL